MSHSTVQTSLFDQSRRQPPSRSESAIINLQRIGRRPQQAMPPDEPTRENPPEIPPDSPPLSPPLSPPEIPQPDPAPPVSNPPLQATAGFIKINSALKDASETLSNS